MKTEDIKVGKQYIVRSWESMEKEFGLTLVGSISTKCTFIAEMKNWCGKCVTIKKELGNYTFLIEESFYAWTSEMFEREFDIKDLQIGDIVERRSNYQQLRAGDRYTVSKIVFNYYICLKEDSSNYMYDITNFKFIKRPDKEIEETMKITDFSNAVIGDRVFCIVHGEGKICYNKVNLFVMFDNPNIPYSIKYNKDGHMLMEINGIISAKRILFYLNEKNECVSERPIPNLTASMLPVDTPVYVSNSVSEFSKLTDPLIRYTSWEQYSGISCYKRGLTSITSDNDQITSWRYAFLYQSIIINGVKYPAHTRVFPG